MQIEIGSQWFAKWSVGRSDAMVWTVRATTQHGVYITSPGSRSPGNLLSPKEFIRDYVRK